MEERGAVDFHSSKKIPPTTENLELTWKAEKMRFILALVLNTVSPLSILGCNGSGRNGDVAFNDPLKVKTCFHQFGMHFLTITYKNYNLFNNKYN